jgi:hypothetical protein
MFDVEECVKAIELAVHSGDMKTVDSSVRQLLVDRLLGRLSPPDYSVDIAGDLMPHFSGTAEFRDTIESGSLAKFAEKPEALFALKRVLEVSAPFFVAPLYIGMSTNLHSRLAGHKALITQEESNVLGLPTDCIPEDQSFASEVKRRGIPAPSLFVHVLTLEGMTSDYVRAIEYVLNRATFPILGRR